MPSSSVQRNVKPSDFAPKPTNPNPSLTAYAWAVNAILKERGDFLTVGQIQACTGWSVDAIGYALEELMERGLVESVSNDLDLNAGFPSYVSSQVAQRARFEVDCLDILPRPLLIDRLHSTPIPGASPPSPSEHDGEGVVAHA